MLDKKFLRQEFFISHFKKCADVSLTSTKLLKKIKDKVSDMFEDEALHRQLKDKKFDVVLSETFDFCGLCKWCFISSTKRSHVFIDLADYLEMPAIISVFTGNRLNAITNALGEPSFLHYLPCKI